MHLFNQDSTEVSPSPPKKARIRTPEEVRDGIRFSLTYGPFSRKNAFLPEANEIIPRLYVSDVVTATTPEMLDDLHITHVVSVMLEADIPKVSMSSLKTQPKRYSLEILDKPSAELYTSLSDVVGFIGDALKDPVARVLCHCYAGASRSTSVVAAYLVSSMEIGVDEALALIKSKRRISQPNSGFVAQIRSWHQDRVSTKTAIASSVTPITVPCETE